MTTRAADEADEVVIARECAQTIGEVAARLRPHFERDAAARHAADYPRGLVADVERKNGW